jgi:hypothetical protein
VALVGRPQQLKSLEAVCLIYGPGAAGETAGELVARTRLDLDGVDFDDSHGPIMPPAGTFGRHNAIIQ